MLLLACDVRHTLRLSHLRVALKMYKFLSAGMLLNAEKRGKREGNAKKKEDSLRVLGSHSDPANSFPEDDIARGPE